MVFTTESITDEIQVLRVPITNADGNVSSDGLSYKSFTISEVHIIKAVKIHTQSLLEHLKASLSKSKMT